MAKHRNYTGDYLVYVIKKMGGEKIYYSILILLTGCNGIAQQQQPEMLLPLIPVMGHRFTITGDFDGDGILDTLTERYTSQGQETNKFYEGLEYDSLVALAVQKEKQSYLQASDGIDSLFISGNAQLFGLAYLKNEGDLDGDGADEIGYVIDWADWSNMNSCYVYTYKNSSWELLVEFEIWDWQLPWYNVAITDTFQGLITQLSDNRIQIKTPRRGELSIDTMELDK